jgi:hypothetical protein
MVGPRRPPIVILSDQISDPIEFHDTRAPRLTAGCTAGPPPELESLPAQDHYGVFPVPRGDAELAVLLCFDDEVGVVGFGEVFQGGGHVH